MIAIRFIPAALVLVVSTSFGEFAQAQNVTPASAVQAIYHSSDLHATVDVRSSTVLERFAVVIVRGTPMDEPGRGTPLLLQRFSFGWQPVALARFTCDLDGRGITAQDKAKLAAGLNLANAADQSCEKERDRGSAADIAAIRRQMNGPVVPYVLVADGYAFAPEYGDSGGCGLFRKAGDRWEIIGACKGALTPGVVARYHIPLRTQCSLGLAQAGCPR